MKNGFSVIKYSKLWLAISGTLMVASIVCVAVFGLNFGIDFTGGSLTELRFEQPATTETVRSVVNETGHEAIVQSGENNSFVIRTEDLTREEHDAMLAALTTQVGNNEELRFESIGPIVGNELKQKSILAVIIVLILITLYVAWAFRKVSKTVPSWKYALLTILAAIHDVIIPIGVFAVLGEFFGYQIDGIFIAALLTILGYSINDTIVIFDRIRENLAITRHADVDFTEIVDNSVRQSLVRSINTSLTTVLVLFAILIFGGETTKPFVLALIIGIVAGAYSSIFVASPLLVLWERRKK